jgi:hypothetical protein
MNVFDHAPNTTRGCVKSAGANGHRHLSFRTTYEICLLLSLG